MGCEMSRFRGLRSWLLVVPYINDPCICTNLRFGERLYLETPSFVKKLSIFQQGKVLDCCQLSSTISRRQAFVTIGLLSAFIRAPSMRHLQSLLSPARALLRVLSQTTLASSNGQLPYHAISNVKQRTTSQIRHAFTMRNDSNYLITKSTVDQFPDVNRDYAIKARYVRMRQPDGGLSQPESLRSAMSCVKQGTEHLVQISKVDEDGMAICRIMTITDLLKQKKDKERLQKEHKKSIKQSVPKQIELNWAIGPNDLEHKLTQMKDFIKDGKKVEVVLASKKKQRRATPEEGQEVLRKVREKLAEADGREIKEMEGGEVGKHTVLTIRKKGLE